MGLALEPEADMVKSEALGEEYIVAQFYPRVLFSRH